MFKAFVAAVLTVAALSQVDTYNFNVLIGPTAQTWVRTSPNGPWVYSENGSFNLPRGARSFDVCVRIFNGPNEYQDFIARDLAVERYALAPERVTKNLSINEWRAGQRTARGWQPIRPGTCAITSIIHGCKCTATLETAVGHESPGVPPKRPRRP